MLLLQRYDIDVLYKPGKELKIADTLSRDCMNDNLENIRCQKDNEIFLTDEEINQNDIMCDIPVKNETLLSITKETANCNEMQALIAMIK